MIIQHNKVYLSDCLDIIKSISNDAIDLIAVDLPFFNVVDEDWDNQWDNEEEYLSWIESLIIEYDRILKDTGNIFLFTGRQYNRKICYILDKYFIEKRIIIW